MDGENLQVLVAEFGDESGAEQAVESMNSEFVQKVQAGVAIIKNKNSRIKYKDLGMNPAKDALGGVILGAALGILTGGVGIVLGAVGGVIGRLMGEKKRAEGFTSVRMNEVLASLVPGSSAFVAVVEKEHLKEIEDFLAANGADVFTAEVSADLSEQLEPHRHTEFQKWVEHLQEDEN